MIQQDQGPEFQDAFVATGGIAHLRGIIPSFTKHVATGKPTAWLVFKAMNEALPDNIFYENQAFKFSPYLKPDEEEVQFTVTGVVLAPEGEMSKEAKIAAVKSVAATELYNEDNYKEGCIAVENGRGGERLVGAFPWVGPPRGAKYRTNGILEARQKNMTIQQPPGPGTKHFMAYQMKQPSENFLRTYP